MRPRAALALLAALGLTSIPAIGFAHEGLPPEPHDLWTAWSFEPALVVGLIVSAWLYGRGVSTLWRQAGPGRGLPRWRVVCFAGGLLALLVALVSPLDALGTALLSAHMVQHMLLILVAAPLLELGAPEVSLFWALPAARRRDLGAVWLRAPLLRALGGLVTRPPLAWALHALALWVWHLPGAYQAALASEVVHLLEHASFLGSGLLFWWPLARTDTRRRLDFGVGVLYVFAMATQSGILGALMTFARTPWYPAYAATTAAWGLSPLDDQQLAGLIMWVPGGLAYIAAALTLFGLWISSDQSAHEPTSWAAVDPAASAPPR